MAQDLKCVEPSIDVPLSDAAPSPELSTAASKKTKQMLMAQTSSHRKILSLQ